MNPDIRSIELLSPAGNADVAIEAIKHGADAVYIGAPSHGARKAASNSLEDIRRVVDFAHLFDAKVYVTVNTLVLDHEIGDVEKMIRQLYIIGVDAIIVQDMSVLRMNIPPIALHASTQCDIRTPEKAKFLQDVGFSQLVLARELSIEEIKKICDSVDIPVETFVHGALCVSYSGRCSAGLACAGRSGNRGECPQICRQKFTLTDASGCVLAHDKYLLSLKDFNASAFLNDLIDAGVNSFKIEGRLKEPGYIKNVTAYYSKRLDSIVARSAGSLRRASIGTVNLGFTPDLKKSFNRGFTTYRLSGAPDSSGIASMDTPKSLGEKITDLTTLRPGDGISFFDESGNYCGLQVNSVSNGRIVGNRPFRLSKNADLFRTSSIEWKKLMARETARRALAVDFSLDETGISALDETGAFARVSLNLKPEPSRKPVDYRPVFEKLGNTPFHLRYFRNFIPGLFIPLSVLTALRRELIEKLLVAKRTVYKFEYRRKEIDSCSYPANQLDYRDNVANSLSRNFYHDHGVEAIENALESGDRKRAQGNLIMSTRHCILRELGMCLKENPKIKLPLSLESGKLKFRPEFNCSDCEMHIRLR